jgi:methyl-accepting chemotaxis protein
MKVGTRLYLGFALVLFFLIAATGVGIWNMKAIQDRLDNVVGVNNVVSRLVIDMRANVSDRITSLRILTLMTDAADMEPEMNRPVNTRTRKRS